MQFTKNFSLLALFLVLLSCSTTPVENWQQVSLPKMDKPLVLKVQHVVNPRFVSLSNSQIKTSLKTAQALIKEHFLVDVKFVMVEAKPIDIFFKALSQKVITVKNEENINFIDGIDEAEFTLIQASIKKVLKKRASSLNELYKFSKPYLIEEIQSLSYDSLSNSLAKTLVFRLTFWLKQKAKDGKAVIQNDKFNEWVWWDAIGYGKLDAELIITNQLVASVETYGMDVHSALRGGITNGTTTFSQHSPYQSYVFVSSFPFINNNPQLTLLRHQKSVSKAEQSRYLALIITHEMGHLLFHYGHPYGKKACIMSPMPLIDYKNWEQHLDAKKCREGNYYSMKKGAVKLMYQPMLMH